MSYTATAYADVADLIDNGGTEPVRPTVGRRSDGAGFLYRGQLNSLFGNPESGKTLAALAVTADELTGGGSALIVDLDHNGAQATVSRLIAMGVDELILRSPDRFRYAAPGDSDEYAVIVRDTLAWRPTVVVVDSMGELLPLFGASSNSPDDYTRVHSIALKPFAESGAAVITIDHLAKNSESQAYGSTGTAAKKRTIGGASLRVNIVKAFTPGAGGTAQLCINKDRHGGLRAISPSEEREPVAATFVLTDTEGELTWRFYAPANGERSATPGVSQSDLTDLSALDPPPISQRDVKDRMGWGSARSLAALQEWRRLGSPTNVLPAPQQGVWGAEEHFSTDAPGALPRSTGAEGRGVSGIARGAALVDVLPAPHSGGVGAREHSTDYGEVA